MLFSKEGYIKIFKKGLRGWLKMARVNGAAGAAHVDVHGPWCEPGVIEFTRF